MNNLIAGILLGIGTVLLLSTKQKKTVYKNNVYQFKESINENR